jgi:hypothetical protein
MKRSRCGESVRVEAADVAELEDAGVSGKDSRSLCTIAASRIARTFRLESTVAYRLGSEDNGTVETAAEVETERDAGESFEGSVCCDSMVLEARCNGVGSEDFMSMSAAGECGVDAVRARSVESCGLRLGSNEDARLKLCTLASDTVSGLSGLQSRKPATILRTKRAQLSCSTQHMRAAGGV